MPPHDSTREPSARRAPLARAQLVLTESSRRYWLHGRLLIAAAPGPTALCTALSIASAGATTAAMYTTGHLIGLLPGLAHPAAAAAGTAAWSDAFRWLILTAISWVAGPMLAAAANAIGARASARYLVETFDLLAEVGTTPYGVASFDDARFTARLEGLHQAMREWTFVEGVDSTWVVLTMRLAAIGSFALACAWNWWAALIVVAGYLVMAKTINTWINTFYDDELGGLMRGGRRANYFRALLTSTETGKEVRLFGLAGWLLGLFRSTWLESMRPVWQRRGKSLWLVSGSLVLAFFVNGGVFWLLAHDALAGKVGVGAVAITIQALLGLEGFGPLGDPQSMLARNTAAEALLADLRHEVGRPAVPPAAAAAGEAAGSLAQGSDSPVAVRTPGSDRAAEAAGIDLVGVTFHYPTRDTPALHGLTLHVPAGQSLAVVGVNGAGKSTLIKLICGLYPPDKGTVRIDGLDPARDPAARRRVAVIFQDFVHYWLSLRDNVAFGAAGGQLNERGLSAALLDAGADHLLDGLPHGWETVLSPGLADGTGLSGGQWQRVALARALAAVDTGAGVLVLDEPTAALDVRAEAALFDRFLDVTRGMTTVLVSHRLSSVRHAGRIVVIAAPTDGGPGGVIEDGSHEELMEFGGVYAKMFAVQARRFAMAGGER